jgi:hypothetical protein
MKELIDKFILKQNADTFDFLGYKDVNSKTIIDKLKGINHDAALSIISKVNYKTSNNTEIPEGPEGLKCSICMSNNVDSCLKTCGHLKYCQYCLSKINTCPDCRKPFVSEDVCKVYM